MYSASDYRGMARRALKNYWWLAVGVTLLASILGGTSSSFTPSFSLTVNGDDLTQYYPEALRHALRVLVHAAVRDDDARKAARGVALALERPHRVLQRLRRAPRGMDRKKPWQTNRLRGSATASLNLCHVPFILRHGRLISACNG